METVTLHSLRDELVRRQANFRDVEENLRQAKFEAEDDEDGHAVIRVRLSDGTLYGLSDVGKSQVSAKLGIPSTYLGKLNSEMALRNIDYWQRNGDDHSILWRLDETNKVVRAALSVRYMDVPHVHVVDSLIGDPNLVGYQVSKAIVTDTQLVIRLIDPRGLSETPVQVGDVYYRGIVVRNSDVGYAKLEVAAFIHILLCTNGAIFRFRAGVGARRHIGEIDLFDWVRNGVRHAVDSDAPVAMARLSRFHSRTLPALSHDDEEHNGARALLTNRGATSGFASGVVTDITTSGNSFSGWNIVQAITHRSQGLDPDTREDMDDAAGALAIEFMRQYDRTVTQPVVLPAVS
jgi:hypothetical protein